MWVRSAISYQQLTPDQGAAAFLGSNESRVAGIGPQIGFIIPAGPVQAYLNLKGYWEFAAENRASGWNAWVTLSFSPSAPPPASWKHTGPARLLHGLFGYRRRHCAIHLSNCAGKRQRTGYNTYGDHGFCGPSFGS